MHFKWHDMFFFYSSVLAAFAALLLPPDIIASLDAKDIDKDMKWKEQICEEEVNKIELYIIKFCTGIEEFRHFFVVCSLYSWKIIYSTLLFMSGSVLFFFSDWDSNFKETFLRLVNVFLYIFYFLKWAITKPSL